MFWAISERQSPISESRHLVPPRSTQPPRNKHHRNSLQHISGEGRDRKKPDWFFFFLIYCGYQQRHSFVRSNLPIPMLFGCGAAKLPPYTAGHSTGFEPGSENSCYSLHGHVNSHLSPAASSTSRSPYPQTSFSVRSFGIVLLLREGKSYLLKSYSRNQRGYEDPGETKSHVNFYSPGSGIFLRARSLVENYQLSS